MSVLAKVFISHSRLDGWLVKPIGKALKEIGVEPYIAEIETPEAKPLPTKFKEHIQTSDVTILLLTENVMKNSTTRDIKLIPQSDLFFKWEHIESFII